MSVRASLALIGFTAVVAQIVLLRELLVVAYGNEISLGLMLAVWLLWTAAGSALLGRIGSRPGRTRAQVAALQVTVAVALPAAILLVRTGKDLFQVVRGELLGPGAMLLISLLALGAFCALSGWLFAAASRMWAAETGAATFAATGSVYLLEAAGSAMGGVLASLALVRFLGAFDIALLLGLLNLLAATSLLARTTRRRVAVSILLVLAFALLGTLAARRLERISVDRLWRGFRLLEARNSAYGNLVVVEGEGNRTLFVNGVPMFTAPDPPAAEEAVHYALLQHPSPRSLLLIGGGMNGSLAEALRHPTLQRVDYVELDPAVFELARRHFPRPWQALRSEPRVRLYPGDGRLFVKITAQRFDVVIVNLPEPQTAQLNRFFTVEFFREAAAKMTEDGILSFQLRAAENYITPELAEFLRCVQRTLRDVFPEVGAMPGESVHFFAARRPGTLARGPDELIARLRARHLQTSYVREYFLPFRMTRDRVADLEEQIRPRPQTPVNRDFAPVAYYFDVALWSTQFDRRWRGWFQGLARIRFREVLGTVAFLFCGLAAVLRWGVRRRQRAPAVAAFCIAVSGLTLMALEVLLLLGFQAIYGYVYHQLALLIAAFMAGLAAGSWWGLRIAGRCRQPARGLRRLALLQAIAAAAPLCLYGLLTVFSAVAPGAALVSHGAFPLTAFLCAVLGGVQFPVASAVFFGRAESAKSPGTLYGLDLLGACLGAVLLSSYLLPVFGFLKTGWLLALANLPAAALAALAAGDSDASGLQ